MIYKLFWNVWHIQTYCNKGQWMLQRYLDGNVHTFEYPLRVKFTCNIYVVIRQKKIQLSKWLVAELAKKNQH
jgi:hypothetical protein